MRKFRGWSDRGIWLRMKKKTKKKTKMGADSCEITPN
jgi:hypothetical protein